MLVELDAFLEDPATLQDLIEDSPPLVAGCPSNKRGFGRLGTWRPSSSSDVSARKARRSKGGCRRKQIKDRERHVLVDTGGFVLKAKVHSAKVSDRDGIKPLLAGAKELFPRTSHL